VSDEFHSLIRNDPLALRGRFYLGPAMKLKDLIPKRLRDKLPKDKKEC